MTLLQSLSQPQLQILQKQPIGREILEKDLDRVSGMEIQRENPDELITELGKDLGIYDKMMFDDRINFSIALKKRLILSVPRSIEPGSDSPRDREIAEEIDNQLKVQKKSIYDHAYGYSFENKMDNALDAMVYGSKVGELVWKIINGKTVLHDIKFKHSKFFDYDYDEFSNFNTLVIGRRFGEEKEIKGIDNIKQKFAVFVYPYPKDNNMYGDSDIKEVYEHWRAKKHIFRQRNIHLASWGMPVPEVIYDKKKTSAGDMEELETMLRNFKEQLFFLTPGLVNENGELIGKFEFKLHEAVQGKATDQYEKAIDQLDKQITRSILIPDKLGFSESPGGTFNLAQIQFDMLKAVIKYMHEWIESYFNDIIKIITDLNFLNVTDHPKLRFKDITETIEADLLKILVEQGVIDPMEKWVRPFIGIPTLSEKEEKELEKKKDEKAEKERKDRELNPPPVIPGIPQSNDKQPNNKDNKEPMKLQRKSNPFDAKGVEKFLDRKEMEFKVEYEKIHKANSEWIITQVERKKIVENKDLKAFETVRIQKRELNDFLRLQFSEMYFNGKADAIEEVKPRLDKIEKFKIDMIEGTTTIGGDLKHTHGFDVDDNGDGETINTSEGPDHVHKIITFEVQPAGAGNHTHDINRSLNMKDDFTDRSFIDNFLAKFGILGNLTTEDREALKQIRDRAFSITGIEEERLLKEARSIIDQGIRTGSSTKQIVSQLGEVLVDDRKKFALTIARTNIVTNYNNGRMNFFTNDTMIRFIEAYQYQAIIDNRTTLFCESHDGQTIKAGDGELAFIVPPNHFNCRSILVPILIEEKVDPDSFFFNFEEEFRPWGTSIPATAVRPAKGFGGT